MDSFNSCVRYTFKSLYPGRDKIDNSSFVYMINTIHLLGVLFIQFGILLPSKYLSYYIYYLMLIFISYFYFRNNCFMTIISNYYSGKYLNMLCIKFTQAKLILILYLLLATIFYIEPSISFYNIIKRLFNN